MIAILHTLDSSGEDIDFYICWYLESEALIFETLNKDRDLYPFGFVGLLLVIDWIWPLKLAIHNSKFASIKTDELGINSSGEC